MSIELNLSSLARLHEIILLPHLSELISRGEIREIVSRTRLTTSHSGDLIHNKLTYVNTSSRLRETLIVNRICRRLDTISSSIENV